MSSFGFKLDDFPGNMTVVMAKMDKSILVESKLCPEDYSINNKQPDWLVISPTGQYDPDFLFELAEKISTAHKCKCIRFDFGDGSGAMVYNLYDKGERIEGYYFGEDFSEEMGEHARKEDPNETLIQNGEEEFVYFSKDEHPDESTIKGGEKFLNQLFINQKAELSWDYLPS